MLEERTSPVAGASKGIGRGFGGWGTGVVVDDRSPEAMRDDSPTILARVDIPDIDTPERRDNTGRDSPGSVEMRLNNTRVTVERTTREDWGWVVDLGGASGFRRTPALPGEGSGHATGQAPGIGGVTR